MKTQLLFLIPLTAIAFTACDNDSDFSTPQSQNLVQSEFNTIESDNPPGTLGCIEEATNHDLNGTGIFRGNDNLAYFGPEGYYEISVSGMASSDPFKDGTTDLRFTYDPNTHAVEGVMRSDYHNTGASIEYKLFSTAEVTISGKSMWLQFSAASGLLSGMPEPMGASENVITIALPTMPVGDIHAQAHSQAVFCTN